MSRIHRAIRRAEREKAPEAVSRIEFNRNSFDAEYIIKKSKQRIQSEGPVVHEFEDRSAAEPILEAEPAELVDLKLARGSKIVTLSEPTSLASRQFHLLKDKLREIRQGRILRTISITSVSALEGKTLTAVNLALTLAREIDQKVLLVDANLKNPVLDSLLGLANSKGLADMLAGEVSSSEVILRTRISNFYVLPSGEVKEDFKTLLNSEALKDFFVYVKEQFDWVILDSPSMTPFAEVDLLTSLADGVLVVVRASRTPTLLISKCIQPLKKRNFLGFVFNGARVPSKSAREYW